MLHVIIYWTSVLLNIIQPVVYDYLCVDIQCEFIQIIKMWYTDIHESLSSSVFGKIVIFIIIYLFSLLLFAVAMSIYITLKEKYKWIAKLFNIIEKAVYNVALKIIRILALIFIEVLPGLGKKIVLVDTGEVNNVNEKNNVKDNIKENNNYIIRTNKGYRKYNEYQKLFTKKGEYTFWVNCVNKELYINGKRKNTSHVQIKAIELLLNKIGELDHVTYDDLIKCLPAGDDYNDVQKLMGRIRENVGANIFNKYIVFIRKEGYKIINNPSYCIICENNIIKT